MVAIKRPPQKTADNTTLAGADCAVAVAVGGAN